MGAERGNVHLACGSGHSSREIIPASTAGRNPFSLIELMIVIAIIAIIAAIAIPDQLKARASANEASAISSLRTTVSAQSMFYQEDRDEDGRTDYGDFLGVAEHGRETDPPGARLDPAKVDAANPLSYRDHGYNFLMSNLTADTYRVDATPANGGSGTREYRTDQAGIVYVKGVDGQTDEIVLGDDPPSGNVGKPLPQTIAYNQQLDAAAESAMRGQDALVTGPSEELRDGVRTILASRANIDTILAALDANGDGAVSWTEILGADLLQIAETVKPQIVGIGPDSGDPVGNDADSSNISNGYLAGVDALFDRGIAFEVLPLPVILVALMNGDPLGFFSRIFPLPLPALGTLGALAAAGVLGGAAVRRRRRAAGVVPADEGGLVEDSGPRG